jgi:hypothetical protein
LDFGAGHFPVVNVLVSLLNHTTVHLILGINVFQRLIDLVLELSTQALPVAGLILSLFQIILGLIEVQLLYPEVLDSVMRYLLFHSAG